MDLLALHCRLAQMEKKLNFVTVLVFGLVFVIFRFLVTKVINVLKKSYVHRCGVCVNQVVFCLF